MFTYCTIYYINNVYIMYHYHQWRERKKKYTNTELFFRLYSFCKKIRLSQNYTKYKNGFSRCFDLNKDKNFLLILSLFRSKICIGRSGL